MLMPVRLSSNLSLDSFIESHDALLSGPSLPTSLPPSTLAHHPQTDFKRVLNTANISICNNFPTVPALYAYLDELNLLDEERLRPGWDTYFMVRTLHPALQPEETIMPHVRTGIKKLMRDRP